MEKQNQTYIWLQTIRRYLELTANRKIILSWADKLHISESVKFEIRYSDTLLSIYNNETGNFIPNVALGIVNGHRKRRMSYTENQQTLFLFPLFIDARGSRLTYNQNTGTSQLYNYKYLQ